MRCREWKNLNTEEGSKAQQKINFHTGIKDSDKQKGFLELFAVKNSIW